MAVPVVETNNIISHPEGGCSLQAGEGVFLKERMFAHARCRKVAWVC